MRGRAALGICVVALLAPASASAATFVVNTTDDHFDQACDADCSLRDALNAATSADSVTLPAGVYNLNPQLSELDLVGDELNGAGARSTIIDGGLATRVMATTMDGTAAPSVSGVTIRRGRAVGTMSTNIGGGIQVTFGSLTLINSHVVSNTAETDGGGIGLGSGEDVFLIGSTVAGNTSTNGDGGGISSANEGIIGVANSTITGNTAALSGGGIVGGGGTSVLALNATIAGNSSQTVGGVATSSASLQNTIISGNSGAECSIPDTVTANNSLADDASCELVGNGSIVGVNPALGALTNNGGPTDTRAIGATSIATNRGGAGCQTTDQRGVARPQGGVCDIGAFEYRAPRLTVVKRVVNDHGLDAEPSDFSVHVRAGGADVAGSPQPGSATGTAYTLAPGTYTVSENANSNYVATFSGACSATGAVTVVEGSVSTCTITNDDKAPRARNVVNIAPTSGTVRIKLPGRRRFRELEEGDQVPVGTVVDTLRGRVTLFAAANTKGGTAESLFYDGIFRVGQTKGSRPITVLTLVEKLTGCRATGNASTAARRKKKRRLWGDGRGRFRTKGRNSAATVLGTKWLVEDRCTSTLTRVVRGRVSVRDFEKRKTLIVRAGKRYVARDRP